ncbi:winged helix DNA-binding protein [Halomarina litorea]|uniref:winged helix DNA-binding protein n=1 Tax=Halomarina litorea TaxID=2961595 RepID=UPI0020C40BF4|nr:winged helix DNA-binding protein [Halomarina sp. BCD28]
MRKEAEWMSRPADDQVLETLREKGTQTPKKLHENTGLAQNYAGERVRELARYGLVDRIARGVYIITDKGESWLDEELDAGTLERREFGDEE